MPTILYKDKLALPDVSAVYIIREKESVMYVGSTIRLRTRFKSGHHKKEFLNKEIATIEYIECEIHQLGTMELAKIRELNPSLNSLAGRKNSNIIIAAKTNDVKPEGKLWYPFGQNNNSTSLRDKTIYLLVTCDKSLTQIAKDNNLNYNWLCSFSRGKSINPGVNTIQKLYEYLSNTKLAV